MAKENKKEGDWKNFSGGVSQRPIQPLQLKRTFREAGLLMKVNLIILLLIQCLCHKVESPSGGNIITQENKNIV